MYAGVPDTERMCNDWFEHIFRAILDIIWDSTDHMRTANRVGCLFTFLAIIGVCWVLLAAALGEPLRPGGWWVCGGFACGAMLLATFCFWLGSRQTGNEAE